MEKKHPLLKGELHITTEPHKKRRTVWFFVGLQLLVGAICQSVEFIFHLRYHSVWPFQWAAIISLWYWQFRSSPIIGLEIMLESGFISKWTVIEVGGWPELAIVYKTGVGADGQVIIIVWPFSPSRYKLVNSLKFVWIKFAVWAKIIN